MERELRDIAAGSHRIRRPGRPVLERELWGEAELCTQMRSVWSGRWEIDVLFRIYRPKYEDVGNKD